MLTARQTLEDVERLVECMARALHEFDDPPDTIRVR
jgi:hypothetical protein